MSILTPQKYKVAINCLVYNHEPYLRDCLEGFVMQQTDFPFVAIVHDDASTDRSADIIREYAAKYPDIIHPIYETENQWSKEDGSLIKIMNAAIATTGAKYIAMCEGDDFWTDSHKLQKQVDFLETHPDYSLCFHSVNVLNIHTGEIVADFITKDMPGTSTITDLAVGNYIHTPSVVYRRNEEVTAKQQKLGFHIPSDYALWMLLGDVGKFYKMNDAMAIYRCGCGIFTKEWTYYNRICMFQSYSKLYVLIDNKEGKYILHKQISNMLHNCVKRDEIIQRQLLQIRSSNAYRLGKFLLKPFRWIRNFSMAK